MVNKKDIQDWLDSGIITQEQAKKMLADIHENHKEEKSNQFISFIYTLGVALFRIFIIIFALMLLDGLFLADVPIPNLIKFIVMTFTTIVAYYIIYFNYCKKNFSKINSFLILLGSVFLGISLFLTSHYYIWSFDLNLIILIWLISVLPVIYIFKSLSVTILLLLVFLSWIIIFHFFNYYLFNIVDAYLFSGAILFGIGGLHYLKADLAKIGRAFRITGLLVVMFFLFLFTFKSFIEEIVDASYRYNDYTSYHEMILLPIFAIIILAINLFFNYSKFKTFLVEDVIVLGVTIFMFIFNYLLFYLPELADLYHIIYNLLFLGLVFVIIYIAYQRQDIKVLNIGLFCFFIFISAKFFILFWDLISISTLFILGGILLVVFGIIMIKVRKYFKKHK